MMMLIVRSLFQDWCIYSMGERKWETEVRTAEVAQEKEDTDVRKMALSKSPVAMNLNH